MNAMVFSPLEDYEKNLKQAHLEHTQQRFDQLAIQSGISIEENRATVQAYDTQKARADQLQAKVTQLKTLRGFLICFIILLGIGAVWGFTSIPLLGVACLAVAIALLLLLLLNVNPKIRNQGKILEEELAKARKLLEEAQAQMEPLNALLETEDGLLLLEQTLPLLKFSPSFSFAQEKDMLQNYDFPVYENREQSVLDTLCGTYNGNPFLFEKHLQHTMGMETYHGHLTIHWTETYTDSKGKLRTRSRSQTLHATVTKPKPFYSTKTVLYYGAQGSPDLTFHRDNLHHEDKSERALKSYIRKGEKKLQDMEEDALEENKSFTGMANTEFDVLFGALDRDHETQFRLLFTPLAQTNMVDLLLSETGYGDDFDFYKRRRMNTIVSEHSQSRNLRLTTETIRSHSYDICKDNYLRENGEYFRSIFFDLAPILAIPVYQEEPVHSLDPLPPYDPHYSVREYEVLANAMDVKSLSHPDSKTDTILKTHHTATAGGTDTVAITAHSYDTIGHTDFVPTLGGDGRMHAVPVHWQEYIPLEATCQMAVSDTRQEYREAISDSFRHSLYACAFHKE